MDTTGKEEARLQEMKTPQNGGKMTTIPEGPETPVDALRTIDGEVSGLAKIEGLSKIISDMSDRMKTANIRLEKRLVVMKTAVSNTKQTMGDLGLSEDAIEQINEHLKKIESEIINQISDLQKDIHNFEDQVGIKHNDTGSKGNNQLEEANGVTEYNLAGDTATGEQASKNLMQRGKKVMANIYNTLTRKKPDEPVGPETQSPMNPKGGYKSTPRTRKHRKTYRFTATPKSQTMKKRHRTHKKAKKQAKKQNKQRK